MKPYYQDASVTIYHGDCANISEWLSSDVLVTDPPYGTQFSQANRGGGYGRRQNAGAGAAGFTIANDETVEARDNMLRRWGKEKPVLVFGSPRLSEPPGVWENRLVWDKKRPGMNGGPWRYCHELIFVSAGFVRRDNETFSIITAWPDQSEHIHAKPLGLMAALVRCAPDGSIADPFMGSGTTIVAAKSLGRTAIGIEVDERYCEIAARRCSQEVLELGAA